MRIEATAALALVLLLGALAGCTGDEDQPVEPDQAAAEEGQAVQAGAGDRQAGGAGANLTQATFATEGFSNETLWQNGTFQAHEGCFPAGCTTGSAYQEVELDGELADGAPTTVRAELSYDSGALGPAALSLGMYSSSGTFYSYESSSDAGEETVEAVFLKDSDPLVVQVFYAGPFGAEAEVDYTLRIQASVDETRVLSGMPVEVEAEPGQVFRMPADDEGDVEVMVYGPDDRFTTRLTGETGQLDTQVPADADPGARVLVPTSDSPAVTIETNRSEPTMRALNYVVERGDPHPVQGAEPVAWSFEPEPLPLAVGVYATEDDALGASTAPGEIALQAPNGTPIEGTFGCGFCVSTGFSAWWTTAAGDPAIEPGTYEATYEPTGETGYAVGHLLVRYQR